MNRYFETTSLKKEDIYVLERSLAPKTTSLEGGDRLYPACIFEGSLVSKRLCPRGWECHHCPFFDQITWEDDTAKVKAVSKHYQQTGNLPPTKNPIAYFGIKLARMLRLDKAKLDEEGEK